MYLIAPVSQNAYARLSIGHDVKNILKVKHEQVLTTLLKTKDWQGRSFVGRKTIL